MRKMTATRLLVFVFVALLAQKAQAISCLENIVPNGGFTSSGVWTYQGGAYRDTTSDDPCEYIMGYRINAAALPVPNAKVWQEFDAPSSALGWSLSFEIQAQSIAGATAWDEIKVVVQDLTTGLSEIRYVKGTQLTSTCKRFDFTLANNYAGHRVRLSFNAQPFTSLPLYVDNVALFRRYC